VPRLLLWFGIGAAFMLIEDAGDQRHILALYVRRAVGDDLLLGLHPVTWVDVPYFTLLAALLLYALLRGGRDPDSVYAGSLYERLGGVLAGWLHGGEHLRGGMEPAEFRFQLIDGPVEESLELLGAACLLALVVALARSRLPAAPERAADG
jgi:hypothetical protein